MRVFGGERCEQINASLTPEQSRAARGWLKRSQEELARRALVQA
jgi:hypothetical protein